MTRFDDSELYIWLECLQWKYGISVNSKHILSAEKLFGLLDSLSITSHGGIYG